jgi:polyferredoxin
MLPEARWIRPPAGARLHRLRRTIQIVTSLVLIAAPFVDLLRFDVKNGALILFGTSFGLGELGVAYAILVLSFVVVFAGALLYGRIYCGWMCPQTTLSELVATLERWACPKRGPRGLGCRVVSTLTTLASAAIVAASLVSYFLDPADRLGPGPVAWGSFAAAFAVLAVDLLWLRHRFCVGVCPYGILQNVIQDHRTLGVQLDPARRGECTDCLLCVRACFMGVDIREQAFDPLCLNCGDCIAATRLAKRCPEEPLIAFRYGTESSTWPAWLRTVGIVDFRRVAVVVLTLAATALVTGMSAGRTDLELGLSAQFEQTTVGADGLVTNHYQLSVSNRLDTPVTLALGAAGVPGLALDPSAAAQVLLPRERSRRELVMTAPSGAAGAGAHDLTLRVERSGGPPIELTSHFFVPDRR